MLESPYAEPKLQRHPRLASLTRYRASAKAVSGRKQDRETEKNGCCVAACGPGLRRGGFKGKLAYGRVLHAAAAAAREPRERGRAFYFFFLF